MCCLLVITCFLLFPLPVLLLLNLHYQWQKDGIDLSDDDRHQNTGTDTLRIVKVAKGDNKAHYRCHVKNEIGDEFSEEAVLTVSKLVID